MFMDCIRKQTHQCSYIQYKLKQGSWGDRKQFRPVKIQFKKTFFEKRIEKKIIKFKRFHAVVSLKTFPFMYHLLQ